MTDDVGKFLTAVKSEIAGYLLKDASLSEVISAVYAVYHGEAVFPIKLCAELSTRLNESERTKTQSTLVTLHQQRIVTLVAKGLTNKEIASSLNLSEFTVRNHLHRIMGRVGARNRNEVIDRVFPHRQNAI
jgi:DNA-binding NarL/FixJ family response regulator